DALIQAIAARVRVAVIPARRQRTQPREGDGFMDKEPRLIVCFCNKIKPDRRICSRFEQLARNDMGFLRFASALIWLR
ncbi:MAG: IS5/IS1182 family transposase, partial [Chromatiaceae bacterium]